MNPPETRAKCGLYSQTGEDNILAEYFADHEGGFLVDIGACDGEILSNSRRLITELGWTGIIVEPHPEYFEKLQLLYRRFPEVVTVNVAVGDENGERTFYAYQGRMAKFSTLDVAEHERIKKAYKVEEFDMVPMRMMPLHLLLSENGCPPQIDFLSIDTEGLDLDVLKSMDWDKYTVQLVCVEKSVVAALELTGFLVGSGYHLMAATRFNLFFERNTVDTDGDGVNNK